MSPVSAAPNSKEASSPSLASLMSQLKQLRLSGAADALDAMVGAGDAPEMATLGILLEAEMRRRADKALERRLRDASLPVSASLCDVELVPGRGFNKADVSAWSDAAWVGKGRNIVLSGPTGSGKTWLACAIAHAAAMKGWTLKHWDVPELLTAWYETQEMGGLTILRKEIQKPDILIFDDWGVEPIDEGDLGVLRSVVVSRLKAKRSIIVASTLRVDDWPKWLGDTDLGAALQRKVLAPSHVYDLGKRP